MLLSSLALVGQADDPAPAPAPLALRYSERLSLPAPSATAATESALPPLSAPQHPAKLRRRLSLTASLGAWSGTRRNDSADAVAVPRVAVDASATLPSGFSTALLADAAREQAHPAGDSRTQVQLREAWLGWKLGSTAARLGWQIVNWGRTDVLNPTDNASARDYTRLVDRDADQKLGLPMLAVQQRLGADTTVQVLWQPLFRASRVPLPAQPGARYVEHRPGTSPGAAGLRIETIGETLSASLSYLRGPARLPNLALDPAAVTAGRLDLDHPHSEVIGADAEMVFGDWVVRGESAWTRVRDSGADPLVSRESALDTVLGIERAFGAASVFVQGEWKYIPGWLDPGRVPAPLLPLARGNASFNDELHKSRGQLGTGFALNTSDLRWSLSFDAAWAPADDDWALRPRLRWRVDDRVLLFAGGDWFRGPALGVYGRLRASSAVFAGVSASWAVAPVGGRLR